MPILRVRKGVNARVHLPNGVPITLREDMPFDSADPRIAEICAASGSTVDDWFVSDAAPDVPRRRSVEKATAAPGELR